MNLKFKLIFEGKLTGALPLDIVKKNISELLKKDADTVNKLFAEVPVVLKIGVDPVTASKYESSFKKAGAICNVVQMVNPKIAKPGEILITNIESVPGAEIIEHFGLVSGSTIRAKHAGKDILASLKNIIGGELTSYTQLLNESRQEAIKRMKSQARQLGANAIINVRFSTSSIAQGAAELYAYGTAVRIN